MDWDFRRLGVNICVCYQVTNAQALAAWQATDQPSVEQLGRLFHCGHHCAMCVPYFQSLLQEWKQGTWPPTGDACRNASG
ncbi:MAG: (2Fe-2S)-binding protein [Planctomycetes bacterium]|nr:(2Fe-2S)-binding protein [Planctomycetota bacterium]